MQTPQLLYICICPVNQKLFFILKTTSPILFHQQKKKNINLLIADFRKNKIIFLFTFNFLFLLNSHVYATHSMGADISYECLGNNQYRIRVSFYRDCVGIPASPFITIDASSASCNLFQSVDLYPIPGTGQDITPLCPSELSTCHGGTFTGIQEWVYEGIITLPAQCTDWQLVYEQCCRNGAITTINNPLGEELLIYAMLNNTLSPCNNSPTFSNKPVPFVCLGQQFCFNHGAFDVDGDSLVYQVVDPLSYFGQPVLYNWPYNPYQPLNSNPSMTIDPQTGDFCMTPQSLEVTVMAVLVKEYRNGVFIGEIERDIQVTVINCANNLPTLSGINGTNSFSATICADAPYCFNAFSNDPDLGQNVTVVWNGAITGANFTAAGPPHPTGTFCWTPTQADASPTPHCFTAQVSDDACPFLGSQTYSFCFTVVNVSVNAGPDQVVSCGGLATINAAATTSSGNVNYQWSNGSTAASQTVGVGTYTVTVANGQCTATDVVQVTTTVGPVAAFSAPPVCTNSPITFTDLSNGNGNAITSWNWNFNNNGSSTLQNPVFQFPFAGNYYVCLAVGSSANCPDTVCQFVTVDPEPVASFSTTDACAGPPLFISNNSTPIGNNYFWDFGNGTTSTSSAPSVTYSTPGSYSISMIATNSFGCTDTVQQSVNVYALPTAAFNSAIVDPCLGGLVNFTDASSANVVAWNWDFGNGQTSTSQNPSNTFSAGTHNVLLTVTTANACSATINQTVTINPPFNAAFSPAQNVCIGSTANISASGGTSYLWSNGATTSAISVAPNLTTTYSVTISDVNGCSISGQIPVNVNQLPVVFAGTDQSICTGSNITLNASGANSYVWSNGSVTPSINVSPTSNTTYIVTGTDANGCSTSDTVAVNINPNLTVTVSNAFICPGASTTLDAGHPNANYLWSSGQTTQTINVNQGGIFDVTVTDANGCTGIGQSTVTAGNLLVDNSSVLDACAGISVIFDAGNPGNQYLWSTGATSQTINVDSTGNYQVVVTDVNGCSDSFTSTFTSNPLPVVYAGTDQLICTGMSTILMVSGASNFLWSDGSTTSSINVSPVLNTTYTVTGTDGNGCSSSDTVAVNINPNLIVTPGNAFICPGATAVLDAGHPNANYLWSTGETSQTITVNLNGTFDVTVTDANGCTGIGQSNVIMGGSTLSNNSMSADACSGLFSILDAGNPGCTYLWNTGDTTQTISINTTGSYQVVVTDLDGCTTTFSSTFTANPLPNVTFSSIPVCLNDSVTFTNHSTISIGTLTGYQWSFGDGMISASQNPNHLYGHPGTYNVNLVATSVSGCSGNATGTVTIYALPVSGFSNAAVCLGDTTSFSNLSTVTNDTINYWQWNFGDGGLATGENQQHIYNTFGNFPVQLLVRTQHGCEDTITNNVVVNPLPLAVAGPDTIVCSSVNVILGDISVNGVNYDWSPSTYLNQTNTSYAALTIDNYTLNFIDLDYHLITTNQYGCMNEDDVHVRVKPLPPVTFSAPPPQCLKGNSFSFVPSGHTDSNSSLLWNFGSNSNHPLSSSINPPAISYVTAGIQPVTLDYSYMGCPGIPVLDSVLVWEMPLAGFIPSPYEGCAPLDVTFYNLHTDTNYRYTWQIQGQTFHEEKPSWKFDNPGEYTALQLVENQYGCKSDPVSTKIEVYPVPVAGFTNSPDSAWIHRAIIEFDNSSIGASIYNWDFGDGTTDNFFNGTHNYTDTGTYDITLVVLSDHGCRDTVYGKIRVYEGFSFFVPNAFTPNNDGDNDAFQGYGTFLHSYEMWIFDRWGLQIYHTQDYNKPWDGTINSPVQSDTYVYRIRVTDYTDKPHVFIGSVTLVR